MATKSTGPSANALEKFEAAFAKSFGDGVLKRGENVVRYNVIPTGSLGLDYVLGPGGYVKGRIVESWGPEGVGKTTMALLGASSAQRTDPDKMVGFIDMEQALDLEWAKKLGVDLSRLYHVQPETAEDVADILKAMTDSGMMNYIVLDSIGGMITKEETEKDAEQVSVGTSAKVITRMMKIAAVQARKHEVVINIINQVRANLAYGGDTTTGGGFALKHATSHKLKFRKAGIPLTIGSGEKANQVGQKIAVKVEKNKVAPPGRVCEITLLNQDTAKYGKLGVDQVTEAVSLGIKTGVIVQSGAKYTLPGGQEIRGRETVEATLVDSAELVQTIREQILASIASEVVDDEIEEG